MRVARSFSTVLAGLLVLALGASGAMTAFSSQTAARRVTAEKSSKGHPAQRTVVATDAAALQPRRHSTETSRRTVVATKAAVFQEGRSGANRIHLSVDGLLTGRFEAADPQTGELVRALRLEVLFLQNGRLVARAVPGESGVFQATGLHPGVYSMVVLGDVGFLAYAIEVLPPAELPLNDAGGQIHAAIVPPIDFPVVRQLIREHAPRPGVAQSVPDVPRLMQTAQVQDAVNQETNRSAHMFHTLEIDADGSASGRLVRIDGAARVPRPVGEMNVFLIQSGRIVAESPVAADGTFRLRGLRPGYHSLVAAGTDGFAAMGIHIVESQVQARNGREEAVRPVSNALAPIALAAQPGGGGIVLEVPVINPADIGPVQAFAGGAGGPAVGPLGPVPVPPPPVAAPVAGVPGGFGGGFGGPFGGGGGFGSGAGLLGALAGVGAGLGIGAAVFDEEDVPSVIISPASPFQP